MAWPPLQSATRTESASSSSQTCHLAWEAEGRVKTRVVSIVKIVSVHRPIGGTVAPKVIRVAPGISCEDLTVKRKWSESTGGKAGGAASAAAARARKLRKLDRPDLSIQVYSSDHAASDD